MAEPSDFEAIRDRIRAMWSAGDFGVLSRYRGRADEELLERIGVRPHERVLDVACGTGGFSVLAAKAGAQVTAIDLAPSLITQAQARARHEGVRVQFDQGDAEALPYPSGSFETVISRFGIIFAPRPERAASELARVAWPGGRIILDNMVAEGFGARLIRLVGTHVPPSPRAPDPLQWGDEDLVRARLGRWFGAIQTRRLPDAFEYPFSPLETANLYFQHLGPLRIALESLVDRVRKEALKRDVEELFLKENKAGKSATRIESEFLEVIAKRL
jgi:SAM-dependent methyltransferase